MATTKKTDARRTARPRTSAPRAATSAKRSLATRTGKAFSDRPVASAAVATGLVSGIAAAIVGFLAFKKSGKSIVEFSGDLATSVKETASETSTMVKDGIADAGAKAKERVSKLRDGVDDEKSQAEIAEEALTLKETGKSSNVPTDPVIEQQSKVGAISY